MHLGLYRRRSTDAIYLRASQRYSLTFPEACDWKGIGLSGITGKLFPIEDVVYTALRVVA
jgi:hypothetical protein